MRRAAFLLAMFLAGCSTSKPDDWEDVGKVVRSRVARNKFSYMLVEVHTERGMFLTWRTDSVIKNGAKVWYSKSRDDIWLED